MASFPRRMPDGCPHNRVIVFMTGCKLMQGEVLKQEWELGTAVTQ